MAKVIFPFEIKHNKSYYPPGSAIEADGSELDELLSAGGKLIEESVPKPKPQSKARGKK